MAKLYNAATKVNPLTYIAGRKFVDKFHPIGASIANAAKPPPAPQVTPMPDEDAIQQAKRRANAAQLGRTGRASTILTDTTDRLGP